MVKKLIFAAILLLLCSACVSRTVIKNPGLQGGTGSNKNIGESKVIWFWDKDY
jgi:hypothetical protein